MSHAPTTATAPAAVADLIAALDRPRGIHPGLARHVSAQLTLLGASPRPAHRVRRISPFPVRRLARSRRARPALGRLAAPRTSARASDPPLRG